MGEAGAVRAEKHAQIEELRRRMAAIPARGAGAATRALPVSEPAAARAHAPELVPSAPAAGNRRARHVDDTRFRREILPVPGPLGELLPDGGLVKGTVIEYAGAGSLLTGLLAAVTASGGYAAAIGLPRLGLLAAAEMGAQLERLAVVPDPGPDPVEVAAVLLEGLDLVVLGLGGRAVPLSRTRVLAARARSRAATLVVTGGSWAGSALRIDTRVAGYEGLGRGCGRLRTVRLDVSVRGRSAPPRRGELTLRPAAGADPAVTGVEWAAARDDAATWDGAVAQGGSVIRGSRVVRGDGAAHGDGMDGGGDRVVHDDSIRDDDMAQGDSGPEFEVARAVS
ncbi:hypothetical protein [Nocardia stercoris]|uniref:hypothetical protein n=1 Tax=Nocardia stercoris TaxID=2483361 RepID=UPI0018F45EFE|nr:hypothetical protein [Nocardia stercoris]